MPLEFKVPADALVADPAGRPIAPGDSNLVEARGDPECHFGHLKPHGIAFRERKPPAMRWGYTLAELQLISLGAVDRIDEDLGRKLLGLRRAAETCPRKPEADRESRWTFFPVDLRHFSNCMVAR